MTRTRALDAAGETDQTAVGPVTQPRPTKARKSTTRAGSTGKLRQPPKGAKASATYEKLIEAAGALLGEVGFERLTTNGIAARAQMTPPALYRYFDDKYQILEELARRLLKRQFDAYAVWMFAGGDWHESETTSKLENWFRIAADIVATEPGGVWTMRALRALPNLAHVRLESQRLYTDHLTAFYSRLRPDIPAERLWQNLRIRVEFGYAVDELALEEERLSHEILFREAARMMRHIDETFPLPKLPE